MSENSRRTALVVHEQPVAIAANRIERLHANWLAFINYCADLGHGEIERLKIQDGLPVLAEVIKERVKFT